MIDLNLELQSYQAKLSIKTIDGKVMIKDAIRHKYLVFQPEEMVRQLCICYLVAHQYAPKLIQQEKKIKVFDQYKRFDIIVYDKTTKPLILVECKAPEQKLDQSTLDQVQMYNKVVQAPYIWATNGAANYVYYCADGQLSPCKKFPMIG